jgi:hypothetical protein
MTMLSQGVWKFTGLAYHLYDMEEFDRANEEMEEYSDGFIKGLVRC